MNKNLFEKYFKDPRIGCAVEMHTTGWCNLNCKYCYIPKHDNWKGVHKKIKENIENGTLLEKLLETFGPDLEYLSHWGTEPTLSLSSFKEFYEDAFVKFPNLKEISFSSNFMTNIKLLTDWIENLPKTKSVNLKIQCSIDGPEWINDANRQVGATKAISKNLISFVKWANSCEQKHKISLCFKPTVGANFFMDLANIEKFKEYYDFFDNLLGKLKDENINRTVNITYFVNPTIVFPYNFTQNDGILFNQIYDNTDNISIKNKYKHVIPNNNYYTYITRLKHSSELYTKRWMFTCSAGDSCFAFDHEGYIRPCHRLYFMEKQEYIDSTISNLECRDVTDQHALESGTLENMRKNLIVKSDDEKAILKFLNLQRAYHDFARFTINNNAATILELADCGQILPIYKDFKMADLFAHFISLFECPVEKELQFGSTFLPDIGIIRLFGNGVFHKMCQRYVKEGR